jgi:predicted metal-dependent HD superfamily phosphohydrolase
VPRDGDAGAVSAAALAALEARWRALWHRLGARGDGRAEFAELAARYAEPARHYHTLAHVADCLAELDRERAAADGPDEVEAALWLHDIVYDPRAGDNEAQSAGLAARMLGAAGVAEPVRQRIGEFILATTHAAVPPAGDAGLVCDADLAILGAEPARYARYVELIRQEFAWVPAPLFRRRRAAVLARFLDRAAVYGTEPFRSRCEAAARRNLSAELAELTR